MTHALASQSADKKEVTTACALGLLASVQTGRLHGKQQ